MNDLKIRRRSQLKHHYTLTSNVLLFGYKHLSDSAKLTYQVVDSFDWQDGAGLRKGYAYPSLGTLAEIRGVDQRTIRRHLAELERIRLVTRKVRPGRPNLLVIEDPSAVETQHYLERFGGAGEDKNVPPTPDKNVRPHLQEAKEQETLTSLTWVEGTSRIGRGRGGGSSGPGRVGDLVKERVDWLKMDGEKIRSPTVAKREWLAGEMLKVLKDHHSLGFYRKVATTVPEHRVFEALSEVRLAGREGRVEKSKGALFASIVKTSSPRGDR